MAWDFNDSDKRRPTRPQTRFLFGALVMISAVGLAVPIVSWLLR